MAGRNKNRSWHTQRAEAERQRMIRVLSGAEGLSGYFTRAAIKKIESVCDDEEIAWWSGKAKEIGRKFFDFGARLADKKSGSGMDGDEPARSAARYLGMIGGKKGGHEGGKLRMAAMSPQQRSELGRKAAASRWEKARDAKKGQGLR